MTEAQWSDAERAWNLRSERRRSEDILASIGLPAGYLDKLISSTGWALDVAIDACLMAVAGDGTRSRHDRKMANFAIARRMIAVGDARWRPYAEQARREELTDLRERTAGVVVGVSVAKSGDGLGPQCDRHAGRVFAIQEALDEMPLPCGEKCTCWWRTVLRHDLEALASWRRQTE